MLKDVKLMTTDELAERWQVKSQTIRKWRVKKTGPDYIMINNTIRYDYDTIKKFESKNIIKAKY